MELGVTLSPRDCLNDFRWCVQNGLPTCQLYVPDPKYGAEEGIKQAVAETGIEITALIATGSGPHVYDFYNGPLTLGIVPPTYRAIRIAELIAGAEAANRLGVGDVCGHMGFIPENPNEPAYAEVVANLRYICERYAACGVRLSLETGQETPVTLLRLLTDVGMDNLGLNFDPANLLMYGKANPVDALDIVGKYIFGVHAKDGDYPTDPRSLGRERPLGFGRVNFPVFIKKLAALGYDGALTIEREIEGEEQRKDIISARDLLRSILSYK